MSKNAIKIILDREFYHPGDELTGYVEIIIGKTVEKSKGLYIIIKGSCHGSWDLVQGRSYRTNNYSHSRRRHYEKHFEEEEVFFNHLKFLLNGQSVNENIEIPVGTYSYNLNFKLPEDIPENIKGIYGSIKYDIEARLELPWKFDLGAKKNFTVTRVEDLNLYPELKNPQQEEILKNSFGCCSLGSGPLLFHVKIQKTGYIPGENLLLIIEYGNYSDKNIKCTRIEFFRCEKYTSVSSRNKRKGLDVSIPEISKFVTAKILDIKAEGCPRKSENSINHIFQIPLNIPVNNQKFCQVLQISYELKITAECNPCVQESITFPITIGNVAIENSTDFNQNK